MARHNGFALSARMIYVGGGGGGQFGGILPDL